MHDPTNPNRLNEGKLSVANKDSIKPIARPDTKLRRGLKIGGLILSILAGGVVAAGAAGVPLPPVLVNAAKVILEIGKHAAQTDPAELPQPVDKLK